MADALDSGSSGSNPVRVQVPFSALDQNPEAFKNKGFRDFLIPPVLSFSFFDCIFIAGGLTGSSEKPGSSP